MRNANRRKHLSKPRIIMSTRQTASPTWFQEARWGMFVHWGLYSAGNLDCYNIMNMGIPVREYIEKLDPLFTGRRFDADQLISLAVNAGCKYMVMTTRHHEGYCLWNTDTTRFSSFHLTPKRDFIAEYVRAARKVGIRIGFYYSLMDWRYQAYWSGPRKDPKGWNSFVDYVHAQVRELMTRYGKIDILWYDGHWRPIPHLGSWVEWDFKATDEQMAEAWRAAELNEMVRKLQPDILLNNRTYLPGDFGTPETVIRPEARPWEMCDASGYFWGYSSCDHDRKSAVKVISNLTSCVAQNGNLLLNVGPRPDGTIVGWQRRLMEQVGEWLRKHGEALYGCQGESQHPFFAGLAPWHTTRKGNHLYLHLLRYPGSTFSLANTHDYCLLSAQLLDDGRPLEITREPTRDIVLGLPRKSPDPIAAVVKIRFRMKTEAEKKARRWIALPNPDRMFLFPSETAAASSSVRSRIPGSIR